MASNQTDSSDDFFNSFAPGPKKTATQLNLGSKPPPPPPAAARSALASGASASYYSSSSTTNPRKPAAAPPPNAAPRPVASNSAPAGTLRKPTKRPVSRPAASNNTTSTTAAGGQYGATAAYTAPSSNPSSTSSSYYGNSAAIQSASGYPYSGAGAASSSYDYGAQGMATTTPAPAAPQVMNPYMLGTTSASAAPGGAPAPQAVAMDGGLSGSMDSGAGTFSGTMNSSAPSASTGGAQPATFVPQLGNANAAPTTSSGPYDPNEFANEPPLLEELGINVEHIAAKMRSVVLPFRRFGGNMDATVIQDADLAGPIALGLLLGGELMLSGKLSFSYIYGFGLFGCISMTMVLNFMSPQEAVSFWTVTSILGYSLLPVNVLALVKILVVNLANMTTIGRILGFLTVIWCTVSSTRLMEQGCDMRNQRYLIAYPIALFFTAFVMITIF